MNKYINQIFSLQAESRNDKSQQVIMDTFLNMLYDIKIVFDYYYDMYGNLYITKGYSDIYACYVAHVDQVHTIADIFKIWQDGNILFATGYASKYDYFSKKQSKKQFGQVGVGGDDKAGIYICFEMLRNLNNCKVVLFKDEEIGCKGSDKADMEFFTNCSFVAQADRNGKSDFISHTNGVDVCTTEFINLIKPELKIFKYKEAFGTCTDIGQLTINGLKCVSFNVSCGYYNAHTSKEYQNIKELENCKNFFIALSKYSFDIHPAPIDEYYDTWSHDESENINYKDFMGKCDFCGVREPLSYDKHTFSYLCNECYSVNEGYCKKGTNQTKKFSL